MKKLQIGFEAEVVLPVEFVPKHVNHSQSYYWRRKKRATTFDKLADHLNTDLGVEAQVFTNWHERKKCKYLWYIEPDTSISSGHKQQSAEIVSPAFNEDDGIQSLKELFKWMRYNGIKTNSSTGLHVSISFKDPHGINFLKLLLMLEPDKIAAKYRRSENVYAKSILTSLINQLWIRLENPKTKAYVVRLMADNDYAELDVYINKILWKILKDDRYYQFNIQNFTSKGYTEFRILGGKNYHEDRRVFASIKKFCNAYRLAESAQKKRDVYYRRLEDLICTLI